MTLPTPASAMPPLSKARRAGDFLYLSGQMPRNAAGEMVGGDIVAQTRQVLSNLKSVLEENGASLKQVVKATVWLTDAAHFAAFNQTYREFFQEPFPARSTVMAQLMLPGADVEVEVVAFLG